MLDQHPPIKHIIRILGSLLILALAGCNFPGLSPATPTAEVLSSPTLPPAESQVPESETATTTVTEVVPDPIATPTQTLPPVLHDQCRPFPDQLYPALTDGWLKSQIWVKCGGSSEPYPVRSPVDGVFWDYSNQTGKLVYGTVYTPGPDDLDVWVGDYALWVYDYRTDMSTQWIKGGVLEAKWAPEVESDGIQQLAVLLGDGNVALVTGPEQIEVLVNIDRYDIEMDACCIAWSPKGDRLAYVKNETLYVVPTTPQEPRMLAENAFGQPIWVLDQKLLLFPSSTLKVAWADGSGPFIPHIPDGNRVWAMPESDIFWDPDGRTLVFDEIHIAGMQQAITWVYGFSEDFETVIELYSFVRKEPSYLLSWHDQGQTVITSNGVVIPIRPDVDRLTVEGVIDRLYQGRYMLWLEDDPYPIISVSLRAHIEDAKGNRVSILDLDKGMKIWIAGKNIAEGSGFLAEEIRIIDE